MMTHTIIPVVDGSIAMSWSEALAILNSISQPSATKLFLYVQDPEGSRNMKRKKADSIVFIFTTNTGSRIVARLPTTIAGPPQLTTNSEVATMTYLQSKLALPIPKILDWSDDPTNPIGAEYIIQQHVAGVQLHQIWRELNSEQHMLCTKMLSMVLRKLASLEFTAIGSIYFADAPVDSHLKIPFDQGYCIGPHTSPVFWNRNPGELALYEGHSRDCGPWADLEGYRKGLVETGSSRLPKGNVFHEDILPHQGSKEDHVRLLEIIQKVLQKLAKDDRIQAAAAPVLLHPDFHKRNIYVSPDDPTIITGLIDWQSAAIEPAFIYANETPDFAALPHIPENAEEADENSPGITPALTEQQRKDMAICHQTYNVLTKGLTPKLRPARLLDPTLFRLFHYCHTSWRDSATAVRQELIELSARWKELGLNGSCPYSPTDEELEVHARNYEDFETRQQLKLWLRNSLDTNPDGWVPNEVWEAAKKANRAAYKAWIATARESEARGEDMNVAKADKLWPFDARWENSSNRCFGYLDASSSQLSGNIALKYGILLLMSEAGGATAASSGIISNRRSY